MNSYFYRTPATAHESIKFRRWIDDGAVDDRYWGENCCYPNCKYLLVCFSGHKKELCYWPFIVEAYETEVDGRGSVADIARVPHRKRFNGRTQRALLKLLNVSGDARANHFHRCRKSIRCELLMVILAHGASCATGRHIQHCWHWWSFTMKCNLFY